jgi:hypothetical protein
MNYEDIDETVHISTEDKVEAAAVWITALAENDYEQTRSVMHDNYADGERWSEKVDVTQGFCCLGVLRLLAQPDQYEVPKWDMSGLELDRLDDGDLESREVRAVGLSFNAVPDLVSFNDDDRLTFPEIAIRILKDPYHFFTPVVAEGLEDYFFNR